MELVMEAGWWLCVSGVPVTFLLGFYVHLIISRWWEQYDKLPWPDTIAMYLKALLRSQSKKVPVNNNSVLMISSVSGRILIYAELPLSDGP